MRPRALIVPFLLACGAIRAASAMPADKLYALLSPSVWRVEVSDDTDKRFALGSAVVVGPETLLTNCHVVIKAAHITVRQDNQSFGARLEYIDPERDMCEITAHGLKAPAVAIGDSDKVMVGQKIYALGNPQGLDLTLSDGLVSAFRRDDAQQLKYIQISAPISHGSSGGGLFNEDGQLLGITSAGIDNAQNLGFVIPIKWMNDLPARSKVAMERYKEERAAAARHPKAPQPTDTRATGPVTPPQKAPDTTAKQPPSGQNDAFSPEAVTAAAFPRIVPVASGYAQLNDIGKLLAINPQAKKAYENFLSRPLPRAFALSEYGGIWISWGTYNKLKPMRHPDPAVRAVPDCELHHGRRCYLYAIDETVVWKPTDRPMAKPAEESNK